MNCSEETTSIDRRRRPDASASAAGGHAGATGADGDDDAENLYAYIDRDRVWGLNLAEPEDAKSCIKPWDRRLDLAEWTESGVDDQFVLTVPFIAPVRIRSVLLNPGVGDFAPQRFRAYVNRPNGIDFEEVAASSGVELPPTQPPASVSTAPLSPDAAAAAAAASSSSTSSSSAPAPQPPPLATGSGGAVGTGVVVGGGGGGAGAGVGDAAAARGGAGATRPAARLGPVGSGRPQADFALQRGQPGVSEYPLSLARFSNVTSVSVVLSDSAARDVSRLYYLSFRGTALQPKRDTSSRFDVGAANAADAPVGGGVRSSERAAQSGGSVR